MLQRLALLALLLLPLVASADGPPTFQEMEEALTCQCGCGLTVHSCNHLQCPSAIPLRQEIREQLALGLDHDGVLAHFEGKYGEKILSAPTTHGFNLTAWVTPFVALGLGGAFVVLTLRRWRRAGARAGATATPNASAAAPAERSALERQLDRELERFDG